LTFRYRKFHFHSEKLLKMSVGQSSKILEQCVVVVVVLLVVVVVVLYILEVLEAQWGDCIHGVILILISYSYSR